MSGVSKLIEPIIPTALDKLPYLKFIEEKYNYKPSTIAIFVFILLLILSPFLKTHSLLISIVCYLVPGYLSFKAL